jgi:hypothetical protein
MRIVCSDDAQKRLTVTAGRGGRIQPQRRVAAHVVALLVVWEAAAHHHVVRLPEVDLRVALDERAQRDRCEIVGTEVAERSLLSPSRWASGLHRQ